MVNCKTCGRPAKAALVIHQDCLRKLLGQMCDHNCKWPAVCMNEERLEIHCRVCPIAKLLENGEVSS